VDEKAIHERVSALRTQMAEILKADKEQKHSAPHYATKKAAHKARLATLENIKQEIASFSSRKYLSN
jgi:hypothetical protein